MAPPQRSKNLRLNESINTETAALRNTFVTDEHSDEKELKYLQLLQAKVDMGILSKDTVRQLIVKDDPVEVLTIKLLTRLNGMSTYDPAFQQLCSVFSSNSRTDIARKMASKYVQSQALKRIVKYATGVDDLQSLGQSELEQDLLKSQNLNNNPMAMRAGGGSGGGMGDEN